MDDGTDPLAAARGCTLASIVGLLMWAAAIVAGLALWAMLTADKTT